MKTSHKILGAMSALAALAGTTSVQAADELTVAYFLEWPMPFQYGKAMGIYEKELGVKVNWVSFDAGTAMSAAMASLSKWLTSVLTHQQWKSLIWLLLMALLHSQMTA